MKTSFPSRNEARAILTHLASNNQMSISMIDLTSYCIYLYKIKYGYSFVTFCFTNALTDVFPDMNVHNENTIDMRTLRGVIPGRFAEKIDIDIIDEFFEQYTGSSFEDWLDQTKKNFHSYKMEITDENTHPFDVNWFNNSDKNIHPLLNSYQNFKRSKEMLFQKNDIQQIPIDYALFLCFGHHLELGYLSKYTITQIVQRLTVAANNCLNQTTLEASEIEEAVLRDLQNPLCIISALNFIKQL